MFQVIQMQKPSGVFWNSNPDFHRQIIKYAPQKKQQTGHQVHAKVVRVIIIWGYWKYEQGKHLLEREGALFKRVINE